LLYLQTLVTIPERPARTAAAALLMRAAAKLVLAPPTVAVLFDRPTSPVREAGEVGPRPACPAAIPPKVKL
jgi:hypothetical protein